MEEEIKHAIDKIEEYKKWWKDRPGVEAHTALAHLNHTKRRLEIALSNK